ncbi:MAG: hypothetical protein A3F10_01550 [Coxiella sp. RIFCSPHIGHO2_12_FULL_42_15]|nr:MAG: hypothetical protein A3F10_01550 [Coxiella sp. RIFCSPHIGHO2_12_FULL_42_15]
MRAKYVFLLASFCVSFTAFAALPWGDQNDANVPVQVFRQASDVVGSSDTPPTKPVAPPVTQQTSTPPPVELKKPVTEVASAPSQSPSMPATDAEPGLQDQIDQLNQNSLIFQQNTNYKFDKLNQHVQALQQRIQKLDEALQLLNQTVSQLTQRSASTASALSDNNVSHHVTISDYVVWGGAVVIILILMSLIGSRKSKNKPVTAENQAKEEQQGDYDYMGSAESIPAKLNLVRAYLAMENFAEAKKVLDTILTQGNSEQRYEAEALAQKIPPETPA